MKTFYKLNRVKKINESRDLALLSQHQSNIDLRQFDIKLFIFLFM